MMVAEQYDFIIVGAGSAGCVLADKLSENGRFSVLLIEAGGTDRRFWIKVPLGYGMTFSDPRLNWSYTTKPDHGLVGREAYWPRGRVLGGSGSINAMAYVRGLSHDFDDWEKAGAQGWGWKVVKATYDRLETHSEKGPNGGSRRRGNGPVHVSDLRERMHPFTSYFLAAAKEMGWPILDDMNAPGAEGLAYVRSNVKDGRRWSSADAFLRPAMGRQNLTVIDQAMVETILFDGRRAVGVRVSRRGETQSISARRDVIVSAGAINSPQLLQLSGIGDPNLLKRHGIAVRHALPQVGEGLQDHLAVSHFYWSKQPTLNARLGGKFGQMMAGLEYLLRRDGPLSVPVNQCSGFVRTDGAEVPDVQVYCNPASYSTPASGKPQIDRDDGFLLCIQPSRPTSRGHVRIQSADPGQAPEIQPNSLSTEEDRDVAVKASQLLQKLAQTPAILDVTRDRRSPDIVPMTDEELLQNFRERAGTVFHPTCTCRMGQDASNSVLDARLRVHGVPGLRVVDASAFPNITSGNTNAPTMMLAARGAGLILEDNAR